MSIWIKRMRRVCSGLAAAFTLIAGSVASQELQLEPHQELARELFRELIEINTVESEGTALAAEAMARHLLAAGFPGEDVQIVGPNDRKVNLVARLRGRDTGRAPILLLAHLDVVEALRSDWSIDPWTFTEADGYYYGRGVTDDKDEAAIYTANLIRYKEEGFVPNRDIIVALTADEEGGPANGVEWLLENRRDLIDAEYALNEGGGGALKDGIRQLNSVQASEKVYQNFDLRATNPGGHSSLPRDDNAIYELASVLTRISQHNFPVMLNEVTEAYFRGTAAVEGGAIAEDIRSVLENPGNERAVSRLASGGHCLEDRGPSQAFPHLNARLRTTCVATRLSGGHADNALPQTADALVNCRMLPNHNPAQVLLTLRELAGPGENGYNESFNGTLGEEVLKREIFYSLEEAKVLIEQWRREYNTIRPHSSLRYRPPAPEALRPDPFFLNLPKLNGPHPRLQEALGLTQ